MLRQRIITAACLLPLALLCILMPLHGPYPILSVLAQSLVLGLFIWAGVEWAELMRLNRVTTVGFLSILSLGLVLLSVFFNRISAPLVWGITLLWWLFALFAVIRYQKKPYSRLGGSIFSVFMGFCLLLLPYFGFVYLKTVDLAHNWLLYAILVVWCADTGAYFAGKKYGHRKLANRISPGKTQEGLLGALMTVWVLGTGIYGFGSFEGISFVSWLFWLTLTALASVLGDLLESLFKRMQGVKDSGRALPGHGGILDRIDSLTAALPVAAMAHYIMLSS